MFPARKNAMTTVGLCLFVQMAVVLYPVLSDAIRNPAVEYCHALGYNYVVENVDSQDIGMCEMPDGEKVNALDFLQGEIATEYNYCSRKGYPSKHIEDSASCKSCCVCVLNEGNEVRVTTLMKLNIAETFCGDTSCGIPENYQTCPSDCPSGGIDGLCDGVEDGIVDPDCEEGADPDFVPVVKGDVDGDGDVDRNDINILNSFTNQPASVCPNCDMDDDWIITVLDARKLVLLCTRPRCATQ